MKDLKKFWDTYKLYIQNDMLWTLLAMIAVFVVLYFLTK